MKRRVHNLPVRLFALVVSVVLAFVCIPSAGITVNAAVSDPYANVDFETYLTRQGFPESYKTELRMLHQLYPYWIFEAQQTNLEWDTVIQAESRLGVSLTENSNPSSWKSVQDGAYDWDAGKWIPLDSGNWVAASKEIIAYYMDPRNLLDETYIFQFLKQSYNAEQQTREGLESVVENTFLKGNYSENGEMSYIDTLMNAAEQSGVSPYTLASMIIIEQGAQGQGNCISGTVSGYEGYYNYFNVGAYMTSTMSAVQRGLWYAKGGNNGDTSYNRPWNTRTKAIIGGAIYYGNNYIAKGQDTLYLKKFNVQGNNPYTHQYMTNIRGASIEAAKMSKAYTGSARSTNLVFKIPVYQNMPETACVKPTDNSTPVKDANPPVENDTSVNENTVPDDNTENENTTPDDSIVDEDTTSDEEETVDDNTTTDVDETASPQEPNGDIVLGDAESEVGSTVTIDATVTVPGNTIADEKIILSYDNNTLELVGSDNVSGGAGSAVIEQTNIEGGASVTIPVTFEVLEEGQHNVKVESYEVVTANEEIMTLTKGNCTVKGVRKEQAVVNDEPANEAPVSKASIAETDTAVVESDEKNTEKNASIEKSVQNTPKVTVEKNKSTGSRKQDVDASKYDNKKQTVAASSMRGMKKQLGIILVCVLIIGVASGLIYFLRDLMKK